MPDIVRQDQFKNISEDREIDFSQQKFTRSMAHRCLNKANVDHDVNCGLEVLLNTMQAHNVPFEFLPPGNKEPKKNKIQSEKTSMAELLEQIKALNEKVAELSKEPVDNNPQVRRSQDGWPTSVFVLRKMCREKGIPTNNKSTRKECIEKLNGENTA